MDLLAWPVRFVEGRAAVVDADSDAGISQQLDLLCKTRRGERELAPAFGIPDPTFRDAIDLVEINHALALFGPDVQVSAARYVVHDATSISVELVWVDRAEAAA